MTLFDRKRWAIALVAATVLALAACGTSSEGNETAEPTEEATTASPSPAHWTYEGEEGPANWGELDPAYAACADGSAQTPIDIVDPTPTDLADPVFAYAAGEVGILDNGHTVQAVAAAGNTVTVDGTAFPLAQMHFHTPSEHTIGGETFPLEVHFVHIDEAGTITVVGVMIQEGPEANAAWQPFVDALATAEVGVTDQTADLDWNALLPVGHRTYRYEGSLTTPPCTEGVHWLLMTDPIQLSADQIAAFTAAYEGNARPVQPLNGREVLVDSTEG